MAWWALLYFIGYVLLTLIGGVMLILEKATMARIAVTLGSAAGLFVPAWAYWEPDAAIVQPFDLEHLYVVGVVLGVVDVAWTVRDEREELDMLSDREFAKVIAQAVAVILLVGSPALWWGYRAAFGDRDEHLIVCPIHESGQSGR